MTDKIRLTEYSHGAGCGCKIAPASLEQMLQSVGFAPTNGQLLVGTHTGDDAAVMRWDEREVVISTTDFFMPIVDDPYDFGRIAAANALSDIYAMGGTPMMAISILGWPIKKLPIELASEVIRGALWSCRKAGIPLAGGHSIDAPEPFYGLAVTGRAPRSHVKTNSGAQVGDHIFLTKPLGIGVLTTAIKRKRATPDIVHKVVELMTTLNAMGCHYGALTSVHAMTDVTGFGLVGHLLEICRHSEVAAQIYWQKIPRIEGIDPYLEAGIQPGNTAKNYDSYRQYLPPLTEMQVRLLCDPQTSGGLLVTVAPEGVDEFLQVNTQHGQQVWHIGTIQAHVEGRPRIRIEG